MTTGDRQAAVAIIRTALAAVNGTVGVDEPAHGRAVRRPTCRPTRAAVHDYVAGRLLPARRRRMETHLDGCSDCTRAFTDVRETAFTLSHADQQVRVPVRRVPLRHPVARRTAVPAQDVRTS